LRPRKDGRRDSEDKKKYPHEHAAGKDPVLWISIKTTRSIPLKQGALSDQGTLDLDSVIEAIGRVRAAALRVHKGEICVSVCMVEKM
jgi:hypothetical protein